MSYSMLGDVNSVLYHSAENQGGAFVKPADVWAYKTTVATLLLFNIAHYLSLLH